MSISNEMWDALDREVDDNWDDGDAELLWCNECREWRTAMPNDAGQFACVECNLTILCDECGANWTKGHSHE